MKWIEISKAKVKFDQPYLIKEDVKGVDNFLIAHLHASQTTKNGIEHTFESKDGALTRASYVAIISSPSSKE